MAKPFRDKDQIVIDVLEACGERKVISAITRDSNVGHDYLVRYIEIFQKYGLIDAKDVLFNGRGSRGFGHEKKGVGYQITENGKTFLENYKKIRHYMTGQK